MYGSSERYRVRISTCPPVGAGTGASAIVKFEALGRPAGREASRICTFWSAFGSVMAAAYAAAAGVTTHTFGRKARKETAAGQSRASGRPGAGASVAASRAG